MTFFVHEDTSFCLFLKSSNKEEKKTLKMFVLEQSPVTRIYILNVLNSDIHYIYLYDKLLQLNPNLHNYIDTVYLFLDSNSSTCM